MDEAFTDYVDYDDMDIESVVLKGHGEDEELEASDEAFMRGYLGMGEA